MAPSEFSDQDDPAVLIQKKKQKPKKKKKPRMQTIEFLEPTVREKNMAGAYGGIARGEVRRPGIKYDPKRLEGAKKFRVSTADEPKVRAQLNQLATAVGEKSFKDEIGIGKQTSQKQERPPQPKRQGLMKASDGVSSHSRSVRGHTTSKSRQRPPQKRNINDADFE
jgi:hypothetical protein